MCDASECLHKQAVGAKARDCARQEASQRPGRLADRSLSKFSKSCNEHVYRDRFERGCQRFLYRFSGVVTFVVVSGCALIPVAGSSDGVAGSREVRHRDRPEIAPRAPAGPAGQRIQILMATTISVINAKMHIKAPGFADAGCRLTSASSAGGRGGDG